MPMPFHTLKSGQRVKLGRRIPETAPKCVRLDSFFHRNRSKMGVPETVDYWTKALASIRRMYLNDKLGICVIAGKLHQLGIYSANNFGAEKIILASDQEARTQYVSLCGAGDNGCYITTVLNAWMRTGLVAGGKRYTLDGYAGLDAANLVMLRTAIHVFGSVTFGIDLPSDWLNTDDGEQWDVTNSRSVGGHDVCAVGFDKSGVIVATWGGMRTITYAALESRRYVDECYAQLAPQWYQDSRLAPSGFDVDGLKRALDQFRAGDLPDDPPTPPTPDPVPPTPPTPTPPTPTPPTPWENKYSIGGLVQQLPTSEGAPLTFAVDLHLSPDVVTILEALRAGPRGRDWQAFFEFLLQVLPIIIDLFKQGKTVAEVMAAISDSGIYD